MDVVVGVRLTLPQIVEVIADATKIASPLLVPFRRVAGVEALRVVGRTSVATTAANATLIPATIVLVVEIVIGVPTSPATLTVGEREMNVNVDATPVRAILVAGPEPENINRVVGRIRVTTAAYATFPAAIVLVVGIVSGVQTKPAITVGEEKMIAFVVNATTHPVGVLRVVGPEPEDISPVRLLRMFVASRGIARVSLVTAVYTAQ